MADDHPVEPRLPRDTHLLDVLGEAPGQRVARRMLGIDEERELQRVSQGFFAARAIAAILSAKFTWLSSSGT